MFDELVEKAKAGDRSAVAEIIEKLQPLVKASIRRYYNKINEYEDLLQDGNVKILESIHSYKKSQGVHFLGYIKMNLKFLYLDKHKIKIYDSLNKTVGDGEIEEIDLLVSQDLNILDQVIEKEISETLGQLLENLPERQKQVIILYYFEKMSIQEIGDKLGISYRTVVNTKTNGIKNMRGSINDII
jgi:RNA polymerase sporulation-specific sigma factor